MRRPGLGKLGQPTDVSPAASNSNSDTHLEELRTADRTAACLASHLVLFTWLLQDHFKNLSYLNFHDAVLVLVFLLVLL